MKILFDLEYKNFELNLSKLREKGGDINLCIEELLSLK